MLRSLRPWLGWLLAWLQVRIAHAFEVALKQHARNVRRSPPRHPRFRPTDSGCCSYVCSRAGVTRSLWKRPAQARAGRTRGGLTSRHVHGGVGVGGIASGEMVTRVAVAVFAPARRMNAMVVGLS